MAIKISGNTVIDDSQNITATGSATFGGVGTSAESVKLIGRSSDDRADLQFYENDGSTFIASLSAQLDSMNLFLGSSSGELKITGNQTIFRSEIGAERMRLDSSGNLKIGGTLPSTPNISLNEDGSATFTSTNPVVIDQPSSGNSANPSIQIKHNGTINGSWRHDGRFEVGGQDADAEITLSPNGSATFNGETIVQGTGKFFLKRDDAGSTSCAIRDDNLRIFNNPVSYDDYKISLENDGSATFTGEINIGGYDGSSTTTDGVLLGAVGGVYSQLAAATAATGVVFQGMHGATFTSRITADGSATFAGGGAAINSYGQLVITRSDSNAYPSLTINSAGTTTNTIDLNGDGSATFAGTITADGYSLANLTQLT